MKTKQKRQDEMEDNKNGVVERGVIRLVPDSEKYIERPCYCQDKTHEQYQRTKIAHKICSLCYDKGIIYVPKEG